MTKTVLILPEDSVFMQDPMSQWKKMMTKQANRDFTPFKKKARCFRMHLK